jgi:O-antigen/teichoic acid export membrane protein
LNLDVNLRGLGSRVTLGTVARFLRGAGWVVGDQAFVSASNFLGMVIAARVLSTTDFGTYALAYTGIWALNGLQSSLITQPHSVLASHRDPVAYRRYTSATGLMQIALTSALGMPILAAGFVALIAGGGPVLLSVGIALVAWQAQEFLRRVLYFEGRLAAVVALDVIGFGGQLVGILGLAMAGQLTVTSALLVAAATSAVAALLGFVLLRETLFHRPMPGAIGENIAHGRWLLGAEVGSFICMNSYPFLLAATAGSQAVAIYAAAMLILNPLNVIWFAAGNALPIQLSRSRAQRGDRAARGELRSVYAVSMPVVAAYSLAASVLAGPILSVLFGGSYSEYGWVVAAAAAIRFLGFHSHLLAIGLRAHQLTRWIFLGYVAAVPFSLIAGTVLTISLGIAGALVAMFVSNAIWTAVWARAYFGGRGEADPNAGPAGPAGTADNDARFS